MLYEKLQIDHLPRKPRAMHLRKDDVARTGLFYWTDPFYIYDRVYPIVDDVLIRLRRVYELVREITHAFGKFRSLREDQDATNSPDDAKDKHRPFCYLQLSIVVLLRSKTICVPTGAWAAHGVALGAHAQENHQKAHEE